MRIVHHKFTKNSDSKFDIQTTIVKGTSITKPGDVTLYLYNSHHRMVFSSKSRIVVHKLIKIK